MKINKRTILSEVAKFLLLEKMSNEEKYEKYYASKGLSQEDFTAIIAKDPTAKKGLAGPMSDWMINRFLEGQFNLSELDEVAETLMTFRQFQSHLPTSDIKQVKSYPYIKRLVQKFKSHDDATDEFKSQKDKSIRDSAGAEIVYEDKYWTIMLIKTMNAAIKYGKGTTWCTAGRVSNMFDSYSKNGPIYILTSKLDSDEKYQLHKHSNQIKDTSDAELTKPITREVDLTRGAAKFIIDTIGFSEEVIGQGEDESNEAFFKKTISISKEENGMARLTNRRDNALDLVFDPTKYKYKNDITNQELGKRVFIFDDLENGGEVMMYKSDLFGVKIYQVDAKTLKPDGPIMVDKNKVIDISGGKEYTYEKLVFKNSKGKRVYTTNNGFVNVKPNTGTVVGMSPREGKKKLSVMLGTMAGRQVDLVLDTTTNEKTTEFVGESGVELTLPEPLFAEKREAFTKQNTKISDSIFGVFEMKYSDKYTYVYAHEDNKIFTHDSPSRIQHIGYYEGTAFFDNKKHNIFTDDKTDGNFEGYVIDDFYKDGDVLISNDGEAIIRGFIKMTDKLIYTKKGIFANDSGDGGMIIDKLPNDVIEYEDFDYGSAPEDYFAVNKDRPYKEFLNKVSMIFIYDNSIILNTIYGLLEISIPGILKKNGVLPNRKQGTILITTKDEVYHLYCVDFSKEGIVLKDIETQATFESSRHRLPKGKQRMYDML